MRQKMRKNVPNCCLTLMKYLNLHLPTLKELKNAKKVKWDRPTDQPTNQQTDIVTCRVACMELKIGSGDEKWGQGPKMGWGQKMVDCHKSRALTCLLRHLPTVKLAYCNTCLL